MTYTALALVGVVAAVLLDLVLLRTGLLRRRPFWTAYAIVVAFQLVTNGWLTGRDIVTYAEDAIIGWRVVFAPVEDLLFGFSLVLQTLSWWVWWGRRLRPGPGPLGPARGATAQGPVRPPAAGS
ncbi:MAG: lycopene cyclase domain-containing protein [Actinomycetes bacterium]